MVYADHVYTKEPNFNFVRWPGDSPSLAHRYMKQGAFDYIFKLDPGE